MTLALSLALTVLTLGALGWWARKLDLRRRRWAWTFLALLLGPLLAALVVVGTIAAVATRPLDAASRATLLARGISDAFNGGAAGLAASAIAIVVGWATVAVRARR